PNGPGACWGYDAGVVGMLGEWWSGRKRGNEGDYRCDGKRVK
nr:hypothetical protein [Tanacetum cinerariifolium]